MVRSAAMDQSSVVESHRARAQGNPARDNRAHGFKRSRVYVAVTAEPVLRRSALERHVHERDRDGERGRRQLELDGQPAKQKGGVAVRVLRPRTGMRNHPAHLADDRVGSQEVMHEPHHSGIGEQQRARQSAGRRNRDLGPLRIVLEGRMKRLPGLHVVAICRREPREHFGDGRSRDRVFEDEVPVHAADRRVRGEVPHSSAPAPPRVCADEIAIR
jgi:hypothetical protein